MLNLDIAAMPDPAVRQTLFEYCSRFGSVVTIAIFRSLDRASHPFALIDMSAPDEVQKVVQEIGDLTFGGAALVKLARPCADADGCRASAA
jgi:hypothetical protein